MLAEPKREKVSMFGRLRSFLIGLFSRRAQAMTISFQIDILPLFRPRDIGCMADQEIFLDDYQFMSTPAGDGEFPDHANARNVLKRLEGRGGRRMPPDAPWPADRIASYSQWIAEGCQP
jgi:hypothetical protein